jgi:hypothetical protein
MEYRANIFELPPGGPHALDEVNEDLRLGTTAGWALHSQSMAVISGGLKPKVLVMLIYERDDNTSSSSPTSG